MPVAGSSETLTAADVVPAMRCHVERLQGGVVVGWVWDPATPGDEALTLVGDGPPLVCRVTRMPREDVNQALNVQARHAGFELELPPQVWTVLGTGGLRIAVNGSPVAHAPLWPDLGSIERWGSAAFLAAVGDEQVRLREWLETHRRLAQSNPPQAPPPSGRLAEIAPPERMEVEALQGLRIRGWTTARWSPNDIELVVQGQPVPAQAWKTERSDVARALGLADAELGFEIEVPGSVWAMQPPAALCRLQVRFRGKPVGPAFELSADALPAEIDIAMTIGDPGRRTLTAALVLEHLTLSGRLGSLSLSRSSWLDATASAVGIQSRPASPASGSTVAVVDSVSDTVGRVGRWLQGPAAGAAALRTLGRLKSSRSPTWRARGLRLEIALTRAVGLFDRAYYLSQFDDAPPPERPLRHYVEVGAQRDLSPNLLFDPLGYRRRAADGRKLPVNALLHYALHGRFAGVPPSAWFDPEAYRADNPDVQRAGVDELRHFYNKGWREGRRPVRGFSPQGAGALGIVERLQRLSTSGVLSAGLARYLQAGLPAGSPAPVGGHPPWFGRLQLDGRDHLDPAVWNGVASAVRPNAVVDVVVPVYAGTQDTLRCLYSVLTQTQDALFELVVIDDCGPEPALREMLVLLAGRGLFTLLVNDSNQGFVRSVNRGLALHPSRDVVILNADTRVHGNWLDRLLAHARAAPAAASITPLSNNATVCSYPRTREDNPELSRTDATQLDRIAARVNAGRHVDVPTGVGFCMFMRRETLAQIGPLDAERFGRGYGEENDWCLRATDAGWFHLIAADIYVTHSGSVSFGAEASPRVAAALKLIAERWPDYAQRIERHVQVDALATARARIDAVRLAHAVRGGCVLSVSHDRGGGTARHEREVAAEHRSRGLHTVYLRPAGADQVRLIAPDALAVPNLHALPVSAGGLLSEVLARLPLREIQVHHLADLPTETALVLAAVAARQSARLVLTVHDYYMICPRTTLVRPDGRYCGEPDDAGCDRCLASDGLDRRTGTIATWRRTFEPLVRAAAEIRVPDEDVSPRLRRHWAGVEIRVQPHEPPRRDLVPRDRPSSIHRVLVIGALSRDKGLDVLRTVAACSVARSAGLRFTLLGYSADDAALRQAGIEVLGAYDDDQVVQRIRELAPDLVWIPSIWPETYSYVLSAALDAGARVAVFDLGAQARRARETQAASLVIPLPLADRPDDLARVLSWGRLVA